MILTSVDLPAPLSPIRPSTSPGSSDKSTSVSAVIAPKCLEILLQLENSHGAADLDAPVPGGGANRPIIQRNTQTRPPLVVPSAVRLDVAAAVGRNRRSSGTNRWRLASFASPAPVPSAEGGQARTSALLCLNSGHNPRAPSSRGEAVAYAAFFAACSAVSACSRVPETMISSTSCSLVFLT